VNSQLPGQKALSECESVQTAITAADRTLRIATLCAVNNSSASWVVTGGAITTHNTAVAVSLCVVVVRRLLICLTTY